MVDPTSLEPIERVKLLGALLQTLVENGCDLSLVALPRRFEEGLRVWAENHERRPAVDALLAPELNRAIDFLHCT